MRVLILVAVVAAVGVICAEALNEDQRRDLANYALHKKSKRALCGAEAVTHRPRPTSCNYCYCSSPIIFGKRVIGSIIGNRCTGLEYTRCCNLIKYPAAGAKPSVDVSSMAKGLLNLYGKRATADDQFKKPSVDLIFLIDDSGSIASSQFTVATEGAATLSQALCPHSFGSGKGNKQVSVVLFSTIAQTFVTYEESQKGAGYVEDKILGLKQRSGGTSTAEALKYVRESVLTQPGSRLNDPDTATIVFVITDGQCNSGCSTLKSEATKLRNAGPGVQVFAFGVGEADCDELQLIRGKEAGDVFGLPDYDYFEKMANAVKQQVAKDGDSICAK